MRPGEDERGPRTKYIDKRGPRTKYIDKLLINRPVFAIVLPIFDTFVRPVGLEPLTENDPTGGLNLSRPIPDFSYGIKRRFRRKSQKKFFLQNSAVGFPMNFLLQIASYIP